MPEAAKRNSRPVGRFYRDVGMGRQRAEIEPRSGRSGSRRVTGALLLAGFLSITIALAPAGGKAKKRKKAKQSRPNIVLIMDDDQNVEMQRFLSKTNAAIGGKGVTFNNSFVNYSLCCPSRATMLTGQYSHNNGVRGNRLPIGGYGKLAPTMSNALPVWLQRSGYYTAHIGKFLNGYGTTSPDIEVPPGWSEWYGSLDGPDGFTGGTYTAYGYTLNENGRVVHHGTTPDAVDPATYQTDVYSQKAADFISRRASSKQPFYLSVAPLLPHSEAGSCNCAGNNPRAAPRHEGALAGLTAPRDPSFNEANVSDKPSSIKSLTPMNQAQIDGVDARYRARAESLLGVDDLVQNVVSTLQASGELKNTVLIFTSDNGFFHGEHRVRNGKVRVYEPSIRVPLLIRGPGVPKGVHRRQPVGNVDLAPTILDFANAKPGRKQDGVSLLSIIEKKRNWLGRSLGLETYLTPDTIDDPEDPPLNYRGVRTDRFVYVNHGNGEQELYDLRIDPFELQNQSGNPVYAPVQSALQRLLSAKADCAGKSCRVRPKVKLKARCSSAKVAGKGKPQEATFYLRGKKVKRDAKPPIRTQLPRPSSGDKLEAVATSLDGRTVSLQRTLHC
ncbi:MAG TPA: sulfatase [Solirubrobacterales bacterium]|nr:sulfatase [Solirubrobacterales bacterium]